MWIKKALDTGAAGLIVPHVNSADEAAQAVRWAKYPPQGGRSVGFSRANLYGARLQEHLETANEEIVVVAQVEHIDGVRAIDPIVAVPGLDAVFIGPYDLSASLGRPGRVEDGQVRGAISRVRSACAAAKIPVGIFAAGAPAAATALADGFTLVCAGLDVRLYAEAAAALLAGLETRKP
jgi:2-dehydro-3-deoxyglucarate aldolase